MIKQFTQSSLEEMKTTPCAFKIHNSIVFSYVENLLSFARDKVEIRTIQLKLSGTFRNKDLEKRTFFLSIEFCWAVRGSVGQPQSNLIKNLFMDTNIDMSKRTAYPKQPRRSLR